MKRANSLRISLTISVVAVLVAWLGPGPQRAASQQNPLRLGMIGLDTSHVQRFTELLNDPSRPDHVPGARVVAAFKGGSPDVEASATRIERFTTELKDKWKVELVSSIEELCQKVDAILLMSVDGRVHLKQVRPVFAAKKPVFIDKPLAGSFSDAREIIRLANASGVPFFSSSSRRFSPDLVDLKNNTTLGDLLGAFTYGPATLEPHHPDLFWYGIHSVEALYTLMGTGCESVQRLHTKGTDVVTGRWKDGRVGTVRGIRDGNQAYGAVAFGSKAVISSPPPRATEGGTTSGQTQRSGYYGVVFEIVKFFQTKTPPVRPEETLEIFAFMEAAEISKARNGAPVTLKEVMQ